VNFRFVTNPREMVHLFSKDSTSELLHICKIIQEGVEALEVSACHQSSPVKPFCFRISPISNVPSELES